MIVLGMIILILAVVVNAILLRLFGWRYRREIAWRDERIAVLTAAVRNNESYMLELHRRCERLRQGGQEQVLPGPCFSEYEVWQGERTWKYWIHWN